MRKWFKVARFLTRHALHGWYTYDTVTGYLTCEKDHSVMPVKITFY